MKNQSATYILGAGFHRKAIKSSMLTELEALIKFHSTGNVERFKYTFVKWVRDMVSLLSDGLRTDRFKHCIELSKPLESLYHLAFNLKTPFGERSKLKHMLLDEDPRISDLKEELKAKTDDIGELKKTIASLHILKERLQQMEDCETKLISCTQKHSSLQAQFDQLKGVNDYLRDHLLTVQHTNDRNLFAMALLSGTPCPSPLEPSDHIQQLLNTYQTNHALLSSCEPLAPQTAPPPPCPQCHDMKRHEELISHLEKQQDYNIKAIASLREANEQLALHNQTLIIEVHAHQDMSQISQTTLFMGQPDANKKYLTHIADLTEQMNQVATDLAEKELVLQQRDFNADNAILKVKYAQLFKGVDDYLTHLKFKDETDEFKKLEQIHTEHNQSTNTLLISDITDDSMDIDILKLAKNELASELSVKTRLLESRDYAFAQRMIPTLRLLFQQSDLDMLAGRLTELSLEWHDQLGALLTLLKESHIYKQTIPAFADLLKDIHTFTGVSILEDQAYMMRNIFALLEEYGGRDFLNRLYEYKHLIKDRAEFNYLLSNINELRKKHASSVHTVFEFIEDVYKSLRKMKRPLTVNVIKTEYMKSMYMPLLKDYDHSDTASLDDLISGYIRDKKRHKYH